MQWTLVRLKVIIETKAMILGKKKTKKKPLLPWPLASGNPGSIVNATTIPLPLGCGQVCHAARNECLSVLEITLMGSLLSKCFSEWSSLIELLHFLMENNNRFSKCKLLFSWLLNTGFCAMLSKAADYCRHIPFLKLPETRLEIQVEWSHLCPSQKPSWFCQWHRHCPMDTSS